MSMKPSEQAFVRNADGSYTVTGKVKEFGKISGTYLSGIVGQNPWATPFTTTAKMLRLLVEDISDKPAIHAGTVMEPKILDHFGAIHAEQMYEPRAGDHEEWKPDFEDEFFTGHIDGIMPDGRLAEVKTTSRPQDWDGKIPVYYYMQASLYAKFLNAPSIAFLVGFTNKNVLSDPDSWIPDETNTIMVECNIMDGLDALMDKAKAVYSDTVLKMRTSIPDMTNPIDAEAVAYLDAQLWDKDEASDCADIIGRLNNDMEVYKAIQKDIDKKKELLSIYMRRHELYVVEGRSTYIQRANTRRTSIDTAQLKRDGVYDIYAKQTEYETLKIKTK